MISGRVQGVGYRYFAQRLAHEHEICGYVKNLSTGSVEVYAIGNENSLEKFKRQLAEGPRSAHVTGIEESESAVREKCNRFAIEDGW